MIEEGDKAPRERCGTCRFWDRMGRDPSGSEVGGCHRYPKVYAPRVPDEPGVTENWRFPPHAADDWCGEWRAKGDPPRRRSLALTDDDVKRTLKRHKGGS
jgi:hypothetical protein